MECIFGALKEIIQLVVHSWNEKKEKKFSNLIAITSYKGHFDSILTFKWNTCWECCHLKHSIIAYNDYLDIEFLGFQYDYSIITK